MIGIPETVLPVKFARREVRLSVWLREAGTDLVIFVHGLGGSKENWHHAWSRPELRDKSLLALDLLGFGHSPRPVNFEYDLEDQAALLTAVIDANVVRRIHLVAHSMGGTIALLLAARTLSRLESLILVEARLLRSSCGVANNAAESSFQQFKTDIFPRIRRRILKDSQIGFEPGHIDPEAFYRSSQSMIRCAKGDQMLKRYQAVPCRKAFIFGRDNHHLGELREIPGNEKFGIESAGHFVMQDRPDAFYRQVNTLLNSRPAK